MCDIRLGTRCGTSRSRSTFLLLRRRILMCEICDLELAEAEIYGVCPTLDEDEVLLDCE